MRANETSTTTNANFELAINKLLGVLGDECTDNITDR